MVQSNPLAIGLKESWEGMLQTAHFSHATGCINADPACLRQVFKLVISSWLLSS